MKLSGPESLAAIMAWVGTVDNPYDLLLGRKTYDIFVGFWPHVPAVDPIGAAFNKANKYVLSSRSGKLDWANSHKLGSIDDLRTLKAGDGRDIVMWGSSTLYPQLLEANLIDRLQLLICPVILGKGKKIFGSISHPVNMKLVKNDVSSKGIIMAEYEYAA